MQEKNRLGGASGAGSTMSCIRSSVGCVRGAGGAGGAGSGEGVGTAGSIHSGISDLECSWDGKDCGRELVVAYKSLINESDSGSSIFSAFVAPGVSGSRSAGDTQQLSYKTQGEQVCAVLYRKVKLRFLSARSVDNMALEAGCRWKTCWDWRDFEYKLGDVREGVAEEEEEGDITEVTFVDEDLELSEGEDEEDEEDWGGEPAEGAEAKGVMTLR